MKIDDQFFSSILIQNQTLYLPLILTWAQPKIHSNPKYIRTHTSMYNTKMLQSIRLHTGKNLKKVRSTDRYRSIFQM